MPLEIYNRGRYYWVKGRVAELGLPLMTVLALQVVMTVSFILFVTFRVLGKTYQAAVLSAGFAGFSLGATPTRIGLSIAQSRFLT